MHGGDSKQWVCGDLVRRQQVLQSPDDGQSTTCPKVELSDLYTATLVEREGTQIKVSHQTHYLATTRLGKVVLNANMLFTVLMIGKPLYKDCLQGAVVQTRADVLCQGPFTVLRFRLSWAGHDFHPCGGQGSRGPPHSSGPASSPPPPSLGVESSSSSSSLICSGLAASLPVFSGASLSSAMGGSLV